MSDSSELPWSNNPNAPRIPYVAYSTEKDIFAGNVFSPICYGIAVILFFQCMGTLLNPVDRTKGGIKWVLVSHTTIMFFALTVGGGITFNKFSLTYIDNREFFGGLYPGPAGYQYAIIETVMNVAPNAMFYLNGCLADGFLLYRCYVIYSKNYWVMVIPCLMYLASFGLGIVNAYFLSPNSPPTSSGFNVIHLELPYISISLSLNVLLTLLIATRLVLHRRNIQNALGPSVNGGLYNTVVVILVESCALYAVASLLFIATIIAEGELEIIFGLCFGPIQVIAPFLITLRVANRTALTSDNVTSGAVGPIQFRTQVSTGVSETLQNTVSRMETSGGTLGEPGTGSQDIVEEVPL